VNENFQLFTESEFLRPMVDAWLGNIDRGWRCQHRQWWQDNADQCMMFFCAATGFMWDGKFSAQMFGGKNRPLPTFRLTMAKAFELVAIYGPAIMNRYPVRQARAREPMEFPIELFGDPNSPHVQEFHQAMMAEQGQASQADVMRAMLVDRWLNYTPREQPHGGLLGHCERGVTAGLVKGRACLWPRAYAMPGSNRTLTGCFEDDPNNLLIDPDATGLHDAKWIAQRCTHPIWWVEREYGLPVDSLKGKGNSQSAFAQGQSVVNPNAAHERATGQTFDQITYYKIWSKGGAGARLKGVATPLKKAFDDVVGDYAYIVVAPGVPFPLNAPSFKVRSWGDREVKAAFQWPIPFWADDRWPVAILDFYDKPQSSWPIAPMAPGLGELKAINLFVSFLAQRIWSNARDFYICPQGMKEQIEPIIRSGYDMGVFEVINPLGPNIADSMQILQFPQTNLDVWKIIEALSMIFDRRTGLTELAYGQNPGGTQPRTAEEMLVKQSSMSVRPDYMAHRVEEWLSEAARLEAFVMRWSVRPEDTAGLFPPIGQQMWAQLIWNQPVETVVREMEFSVVAGSARKPNKDRDVANVSQMMQMMAPIAAQYAGLSTDPGPINWLMQQWGASVDQNVSGAQFGPWAPPPPPPDTPTPEQMQMELMQQELEVKAQEAELKQQAKIADAQLGASVKQADAVLGRKIESAKFAQDMTQDQLAWAADMRRQEQEFKVNLEQQKKLGAAKVAAAKAQARAKPKPAKSAA